jgi:SAM-dependent methyltransferase
MSDGREFYETSYHFEQDAAQIDQARLDPALRLLEPISGTRFLDLGSGVGWAAHIAHGSRGARHAVGVDFAWKALRLGADSMPESSRVQADGTRLPFAGGAFETALSFGSIEHFPDVAVGLRELRRVLTDDGRAVVVVPNFYVRTEQPTEMRQSWRGWRRLFVAAGFEVVRTRADFGPPVLRDRRWSRALLRAGAKALSVVPGLQYQFIFLLRAVPVAAPASAEVPGAAARRP